MLLIKTFGRLASSTVQKAAATTATAPINNNNNIIIIKDSCLERLKQILAKPEQEFLRVHVETGGCSGFSYKFEIENSPIDPNQDLIFHRDNYRVVIGKDILQFMNGAAIEYSQSLMRSSFIITNPVAETKCSCGSSFSVDFNKLQNK